MLGSIFKYGCVLALGAVGMCVVVHMTDDGVLREAKMEIDALRADTSLTGIEFREKVAALKAAKYEQWASHLVFAMNVKELDVLFATAL